MAKPYPAGLPTFLKASKSRTQAPAFDIQEPRRGPPYVMSNGNDLPVIWDVEFRFSSYDAQRFWLWFETVIDKGREEFTIPIRTEHGDLEHNCQFLPDSLMSTKEDGDVFGYQAKILARKLAVPQALINMGPYIAGNPTWKSDAELIDIAINTSWPAA